VIASAAFVEKINTKEVSVDLMEITEKERLSREQAAARLHALADALARHNEVEFERGGLRFTVHVPDEVDFKLEIEIGEDERELEVEIMWGSRPMPHTPERPLTHRAHRRASDEGICGAQGRELADKNCESRIISFRRG
jgi:amphi-Trp domain-containing protein